VPVASSSRSPGSNRSPREERALEDRDPLHSSCGDAVCFAAGIVLLAKADRTTQTFDPEQLLFGSIILVVVSDDLWIVLAHGRRGLAELMGSAA
jgi:hypothetical protein